MATTLSSVNFALAQGRRIETYNSFRGVYRLCFDDQAAGYHGFEESVGALWPFEKAGATSIVIRIISRIPLLNGIGRHLPGLWYSHD